MAVRKDLPAHASAEPTLGEGPAFQQRTNTSWRSIRSQPAVSRRLFRCLGAHLPPSPSIVNSEQIVSARVLAMRGHTTSVERYRSVLPDSVLRRWTSCRCPFVSTHSVDPFVRCSCRSWTNKKPCHLHGKQGLEKSLVLRLPAYLRSIQTGFLTLICPG